MAAQASWYWEESNGRGRLEQTVTKNTKTDNEQTNEESEKTKSEIMNMKAIRIHQYGGPEVLAQVEMQRPTPGHDEVLIKVHAASVNPVDWKLRAGYVKEVFPLSFPSTLGWDVSGTVEEAGGSVTQFKRGDEVYALVKGGGYAEYVVAKETVAAKKPRTLDHVHAAAVPVAGLTALQVFEVAQLRAGQKVLIHAAAGGVGNFAVHLAKAKGAYVIGTASAKNHTFLSDLGVDKAVDYQKTRFEDTLRDVDLVLDTVGGETLERSFKVLKKGGILVSLVQPPSQESATKYGVRALFYGGHASSSDLAEIAKLIDDGKVKPVVETVLPIAEARRAHELSETRHVRGKIVLKVA
jgi:NADPH:quinone reductase-like Zn-dependent oxidoreductase